MTMTAWMMPKGANSKTVEVESGTEIPPEIESGKMRTDRRLQAGGG